MNELMKPTAKTIITTDNFESIYTRTLTENTRKAYTKAICDFFQVQAIADVKVEYLKAVTVDTANQWIKQLKNNKVANSTINLKASALKNLYNFLKRRDVQIVEYNPFDTAEGCLRLKTQKDFSKGYCATEDDAHKMLAVCTEDSIIDIRNKLILLLFATTGMRREEVSNIKIKDIMKYEETYLCLIHGKGEKERYCIIPDDIYALIERYMQIREISFKDEEKYLIVNHSSNNEEGHLSLVSIHNIVKDIAKKAKANPKKLSCHSMRRFYASESFKMGTDINDLKTQLGHSNVATTQMYLYHTNIVKTSKANNILKQMSK